MIRKSEMAWRALDKKLEWMSKQEYGDVMHLVSCIACAVREETSEQMQRQLTELTTLLMRFEETRERVLLDAICNGAFSSKQT